MSKQPEHHDSHWHPESEPGRLMGLSDGIFSVALTIAVIEIMPPDLGHRLHELGAAKVLADDSDAIVWLAFNFLLVAIYWIAHHRIFSYVRRTDYNMLFLNVLFLMLITFMPFAIKVLFASPTKDATAVAFYAGFMMTTGVALDLLWRYATKGRRLVDKHLDPAIVRYGHARTYITILIFGISIVVAYAYDARVARWVWPLLFLNRRLAIAWTNSTWALKALPAF